MITTGQMQSYLQGEAIKKLTGNLKTLFKQAQYPEFMRVTPTKDYVTRVQTYDNMRPAQAIPEGAPYPADSFAEAWQQKFTQRKFGIKFAVTEEVKQFERMSVVAEGTQQIQNATYKIKEIIGADYLVYGNQSSNATVPQSAGAPLINVIGADGVSLFNTAHPWRNDVGNTWSNLTASYYDPNEIGFNTLMVMVQSYTDNTGAPMDISLSRPIIPVEHAQLLYKLMKSTNEPGSNLNAVNSIPMLLKGKKDPLIHRYLSAATLGDGFTWYCQTDADPEQYWLQWFTGMDDKTRTWVDPETESNNIGIKFFCSTGGIDLRGLVKVLYQ